MIYYFSATGNSKYVAEKIAEETGDQAVSIERCKRIVKLAKGERFGIVTPTYAGELPINVRRVLTKLIIIGPKNPYVYVVATFGTTPGAVGDETSTILKQKGIRLSARYSIQMPDTWTPIFDLSDSKKVKEKLSWSEIELKDTIKDIAAGKTGNMMKCAVPYFVRYFSDVWYAQIRKTKHFRVEESCIGCGLCERKCPAKAIQIEDGHPVWVKDSCIACLRCLHSCPEFAIQYGNSTKLHGQYLNPNVTI